MNKLLTRNGKILTYNGGFLTADSLEAMRDCCCGDEPCVPIDDPAAFCASLPQTLTMTVTVNNWSIENWQHPGTDRKSVV